MIMSLSSFRPKSKVVAMDVLQCLVLVSLLLVGLSPARAEDSSSSVPGLPSCVSPCVDVVFAAELYSPTNHTCIYTNEQFQQTFMGCVAGNCIIPETLSAQNASLAYYDAPTRDRSMNHVVCSITLASIVGVFVVIRFAYKIFAALPLGLDD
ncbi:hypothetical protein ACJZ2D_015549 [Fusarium nematophilum]